MSEQQEVPRRESVRDRIITSAQVSYWPTY
jgi:hypothetical protein